MNTTQVILVSGSNSGFGRLTIETLARQGHTVFAGIRNSAGKNAAAAHAIRTLAPTVAGALHIVDLDVTDDASVTQAVQTVIDTAGRLDVVVNNAGVGAFSPIEALTHDQVQQLFDANLFGVLRMNRAALPQMRAQASGLLIQIGSVVGRMAYPFTGIYAASKFALEGLTEAYRLELGALGIEAAIVEPGLYPTNIFAGGIVPTDSARVVPYQAFMNHTVAGVQAAMSGEFGPVPDPQEVADVIAQLIATPAGTRPLRTVVGMEGQREGPLLLNTASEQVFAATQQAAGWEPFVTLKRGDNGG
ncbi:MAG: SDR family oxidoreductase [Roseiflexaceae bacterium]|nr:SDR family oxidoreductase [Roseiflexaceae bacterium]